MPRQHAQGIHIIDCPACLFQCLLVSPLMKYLISHFVFALIMNVYFFGKLYKGFLFIMWQTTFSTYYTPSLKLVTMSRNSLVNSGIPFLKLMVRAFSLKVQKLNKQHTLISGQTHIIQKRDQISMDPLDQALHNEFLEKCDCIVLKFLINSEADSFFLLGWINTGMTLIIKGLSK